MNNDTRISNWINNNLTELSKLNERTGIEVLNKCGKACCEISKLYQGVCKIRNKNFSETNINTLFNDFKKKYYNSDNFTKIDNTITLIFEECTCPMVKKGVNNSFLCNCTIGYSKKLFETLFDKKVTVDLEKSILKGDRICMQNIKILD
jgi:predicted ArsR family transcriptional regulator